MESYTVNNRFSTSNVPDELTAHPQLEAAALEHSGLLHPTGTEGRVSIPHIDDEGRWREGRTYSLDKLPDLIPEIAGQRDTYISQHRFTARREIAQLWQLGAMYVDIDFHKVPELAGMDPRGVLDDCLIALERARKPRPTLAIFSGRGLYLVWLHRGVPRKVAPRWNACQRELWRVLQPFGGDPNALDAARVLRVAGTVNSKSGAAVERIAPVGDVWDFEDLAAEILPMEREQVAEIRDIRAARATKKPSERLIVPNKVFIHRRDPVGGASDGPTGAPGHAISGRQTSAGTEGQLAPNSGRSYELGLRPACLAAGDHGAFQAGRGVGREGGQEQDAGRLQAGSYGSTGGDD